ncbi:MAG: nucleotidyltransferase domain-containing protein [Nitrososphaerota archaeon]|jgi:predicted nucleotidyltransferase|nr:nucleotidyltransferase domain-containing protein [Nitrososphaerota archaeon]
MADLKLRDRDAIQTKEGIIFRVFGYSQPKDSYICDAEYASSKIFSSTDPRAPRENRNERFYKFYNDEGLRLISEKYSQYLVNHEMLGLKIVGVPENLIGEVRQPQVRLQELLKNDPTDQLLAAMEQVLDIASNKAGVSKTSFGVFGSMLHGFHHPRYSDIDFTIYGKAENQKIVQTMSQLYADSSSRLINEFTSEAVMAGKRWLFKNFTVQEFVWHQRRKMIYGIYDDRPNSGRIIKAEFEPVKAWNEIKNEYDADTRITQRGWVRLKALVTTDDDAPFIPSVYGIEPLEVLNGPKEAIEATRIFSYMEEFRQQVQRDETIIVEGALEEVSSSKGNYLQVTLTYCPRYYEQVLKTYSN